MRKRIFGILALMTSSYLHLVFISLAAIKPEHLFLPDYVRLLVGQTNIPHIPSAHGERCGSKRGFVPQDY